MPLKTHVDDEPAINLTPMIDIVFLLLVFFMVGTKFVDDERSLGVDLPEVGDGGPITTAPTGKIVHVYSDGSVSLVTWMSDQGKKRRVREPIGLEALTAKLAEESRQYRDLRVTVRGDNTVAYGHVAQVVNAIRQAGIKKLDLDVKTRRPQQVASR